MANIVDSLKEFITPELISKASSTFGESNSSITKGIDSLIPTVLGGLIKQSSNTSGFGGIFDMIKGGASANTSLLDNLGSLIGGGNVAQNDPKDLSGKLMSSVFGGKVGGILDLVSSVAGLKRSSSSGLMGLVGPLVMSYLGRVVKNKALDAVGLGKFLRNDSSAVTRALPAGMGDLLGLGFAKNVGDAAKKVTSAGKSTISTGKEALASTSKTLSSTSKTLSSTAKTVGSTASRTVETTAKKSGIGKWLLPLLLLLGLGGFFGMRSCDDVADATKNVTGAVVDKTKNVAGGAADIAKNAAGGAADMAKNAANKAGGAIAGLGEFLTRKLPCGVEMNIPGLGVENKVIDFIQDDKAAITKTNWFNFDRLTFATGSANLDMAKSGEQIENVAQIMKCFPNTKIKLGGYTDNTGSAEGNMKLSAARANAVKAAIVAKVIDATRIQTEGYGASNPVATNDTAEGRAQNRRIAVRIDAK